MLVSEAAKKLGMSTQTLRLGLQQSLFPFGVAIRTSPNRWTYHINKSALERYLKGEYTLEFNRGATNNTIIGE